MNSPDTQKRLEKAIYDTFDVSSGLELNKLPSNAFTFSVDRNGISPVVQRVWDNQPQSILDSMFGRFLASMGTDPSDAVIDIITNPPTMSPTPQSDEDGGVRYHNRRRRRGRGIAAAIIGYKRISENSRKKKEALSEYQMELQKLEKEYAWSPRTESVEARYAQSGVDHVNPMSATTPKNSSNHLMEGRKNSSEPVDSFAV